MKIAYFTESLPPNTDGVVNTLCKLVESLEETNTDYIFFSPVKPDASLFWSHRVHKVTSVRILPEIVYRMGVPYFHGIVPELVKFNPDIIHLCCPSLLGLYGLNYARKRKIPVVTSYHTHFISYFPYYGLHNLQNLGWSFLKWFHNQCDTTYVPAPSCADLLQTKGIQDLELWQRGIDVRLFNPAFRDPFLRASFKDADTPILLFVGRLTKEKDLDILFQTHRLLMDRGLEYRLVIVGDGPLRDELQLQAPDAHFPGYQYGEALARWYASADIFVFPSTTETFGNVVLEAFASGLPTVGVRSGGVADLIRDGCNGLIAEPRDAESFAEKITAILLNEKLRRRLSHAALETARFYSWKEINTRLFSSYQNIIDRSHLKTARRN